MVKVVGEFKAIVPVPIMATHDIINSLKSRSSLPGPLTFSIKDSEVQVSLGEQTEPTFDEQGEEELPRIKSFHVRITRPVAVQSDAAEREALTKDDEQAFEDILVESIKRLASAIKRRTEQSSIDTRHPVHGYRYTYYRANGAVLRAESPPEPGSRIPRYALGRLAGFLTPFKSPGELDTAMWTDMQGDVQSSVELPLYDELIYDAETLQAAMEYQMAALSAATGIELMLHEICSTLLQRKGLGDEQIKLLLGGRSSPQLVGIMKKLDSTIQLPNLDTAIKERNAIAHGKSRNIEPERMAEIINTSHRVKEILDRLQDQVDLPCG